MDLYIQAFLVNSIFKSFLQRSEAFHHEQRSFTFLSTFKFQIPLGGKKVWSRTKDEDIRLKVFEVAMGEDRNRERTKTR